MEDLNQASPQTEQAMPNLENSQPSAELPPTNLQQQPLAPNNEQVPSEVLGWNWGAFWLSFIWGIGNGVWIGLLSLIIPFWPFVLGIKGSEWAWKTGRFKSIEEFKSVQKKWARVGFAIFLFSTGLAIIGIVLSVALVSRMKVTPSNNTNVIDTNTPQDSASASTSPTTAAYSLQVSSSGQNMVIQINGTSVYSSADTVTKKDVPISASLLKDGSNKVTVTVDAYSADDASGDNASYDVEILQGTDSISSSSTSGSYDSLPYNDSFTFDKGS